MGTHSRIGVMHGDVVKSVYCHYDGYLEHNGRILQEHYNSARANHLVALGDLSSLCPEIDPGNDIHSFDNPKAGVCVFYRRDRDEEGVDFQVAHTFAAFLDQVEACGAEYYYIMRDGVWYCGSPDKGSKLVALTEALAAIEAETKTWETVDL